MMRYSIERRTRKYFKWYGFLSFARKWRKQLLDMALDSLKTSSKKVVNKTGEFVRNEIADVVTNLHDDKIVKKAVEKIIILPKKEKEH